MSDHIQRFNEELKLTQDSIDKLAAAVQKRAQRMNIDTTQLTNINLGNSPDVPEPTHTTEVVTVPNARRTLEIYRRRGDGWVLDHEETMADDHVQLTFRKPILKTLTPDMVKTAYENYSYMPPAAKARALRDLQIGGDGE